MNDHNPSAEDPFGAIADEFVEAFRQGKRPSVEEFARRYGEWVGKGHEVVSVHISSRMSKTAENAKASAPEGVSVVDSGQVSLGLGLLALFAARMAARNEPMGI